MNTTKRTDDPGEKRYELEIARRDPAVAIAAIEEIGVHLRYGVTRLNFLGWVIMFLLALFLWRVW